MKICESPAKSFYKLKNIKILKCNRTVLREVEILKITLDFSQKKAERKTNTAGSWADPEGGGRGGGRESGSPPLELPDYLSISIY